MMYIITGAPIRGVMAFSGITPWLPGIMHMRLQNKATAEPIRIVVGMIIRWSSDLIIILAMCGTISPIKDMGPQKAVTIAVRSPVMTNKRFLITFMLIPRFSA